jgi:hypothetical protein
MKIIQRVQLVSQRLGRHFSRIDTMERVNPVMFKILCTYLPFFIFTLLSSLRSLHTPLKVTTNSITHSGRYASTLLSCYLTVSPLPRSTKCPTSSPKKNSAGGAQPSYQP